MTRLIYALFFVLLITKPVLSARSRPEAINDVLPCGAGPCVSFTRSRSNDPTPQCCNRELKAIERTKDGRVASCVCETTALSVPSCAEVINDLAPCLSFLQGKSKSPTPQCCNGIKDLKAIEITKDDRVASCNCGKQALSMIDYDPKKLPLLPKQCGVDLNLPAIDKNFDCSKIQ